MQQKGFSPLCVHVCIDVRAAGTRGQVHQGEGSKDTGRYPQDSRLGLGQDSSFRDAEGWEQGGSIM